MRKEALVDAHELPASHLQKALARDAKLDLASCKVTAWQLDCSKSKVQTIPNSIVNIINSFTETHQEFPTYIHHDFQLLRSRGAGN